MSLFDNGLPAQAGLSFPQSLAEKYRPRSLGDFAGLSKPIKVLSAFARAPYPSAWLFSGPSGTGKTSAALALAAELNAEVHHVGSQHATVDELETVIARCYYVPMNTTAAKPSFHIILVDECDRATDKAQLMLLSKLDATEFPPATIFIFTCNETGNLEPRFLSRCRQLEFSSYGMASEASELLGKIWDAETNGKPRPNLAQLARNERNNIRGMLGALEIEILAQG